MGPPPQEPHPRLGPSGLRLRPFGPRSSVPPNPQHRSTPLGDSRTWFQNSNRMQRLRVKPTALPFRMKTENFQSVHLDFWDPDAIPNDALEFVLAACSLRKIARGSSVAFGRPWTRGVHPQKPRSNLPLSLPFLPLPPLLPSLLPSLPSPLSSFSSPYPSLPCPSLPYPPLRSRPLKSS